MSTTRMENPMMEMLKKRFGEAKVEEALNQTANAVAEKKAANKAKAEAERLAKKSERNLFRLHKALEGLGILLQPEELSNLENFLKCDEVLKKDFTFLALYGTGDMKMPEMAIVGENGVFATVTTDTDGKQTMSLYADCLTQPLRQREVRRKLTGAFKAWIADQKGLQVRLSKSDDCGPEEIASDREYLESVVDLLMGSDMVEDIVSTIAATPNYPAIDIRPFMNAGADGERFDLFMADPIEHAKKMARAAGRNDSIIDLLQGQLEVFDIQLPEGDTLVPVRLVTLDPEKPSMYLHAGAYRTRVNLYIPEGMLGVFLH